MEKGKQQKDRTGAYIRIVYRSCLGALALLSVLLAAYAAYAVLAALVPAQELSTGLTDSGMKIGLASLPVNLGKGLPYWAIPRSGNIVNAMNWAWFWNIILTMLLELVPLWLLTFWLYRAVWECGPESVLRSYKKGTEQGQASAVGVIGWQPREHLLSSRNGCRLRRAGLLILALGLFKRTLWLLLLSGFVCGEWDWTWNADMIEYLPCFLGAGMLVVSGLFPREEEEV